MNSLYARVLLFYLSFYENYLLPKVRNDINENRRLSVQLFESLITSIFRLEEFVAGIFLPWIRVRHLPPLMGAQYTALIHTRRSSACSLISTYFYVSMLNYWASFPQSDINKTEGIILAHLLKKASIKARFAAVALALTCEEDFSIPRSMVIEAILNKKYFMPEAAVSRLIAYFTS